MQTFNAQSRRAQYIVCTINIQLLFVYTSSNVCIHILSLTLAVHNGNDFQFIHLLSTLWAVHMSKNTCFGNEEKKCAKKI